MTLRDLEATFVKILDPTAWLHVDTLGEANGVHFLCPKCFEANKGRVGTHSIQCWFVGVDPAIQPGPGRWNPTGSTLDDLSFVPGPFSASVAIVGGCAAHFHVRNGKIEPA